MTDIYAQWHDPDVERVVASNQARIRATAARHGLEPRLVEIQARLHLPRFPRDDLADAATAERLVATVLDDLDPRFARTAELEARTRSAAGLDRIGPGSRVVRRQVIPVDGAPVPVAVRPVEEAVGWFYQERLHYLHCRRGDTARHWGLFVGDAVAPIAYLAFSVCDRAYVVTALRRAGITARMPRVMVLTRAYALPPAPRNAMSHLMAAAIRECAGLPHDFVVTALNPMLGFDGATFRSVGFRPFATVPKAYLYDKDGIYCTRRTDQAKTVQKLDTPPNLLLVRNVDPRSASLVLSNIHIVPVVEYEGSHELVVVEGSQSA